jgi:broad specificity phosphatase PhoE
VVGPVAGSPYRRTVTAQIDTGFETNMISEVQPLTSATMELVLVRHAEPVRVEGGDRPADPQLTPRGRDQAARLAAWLAEEAVDHLVTSPLARAVETVAPVASALGLEPEVVAGVAEWDAGNHEYIPVEELRQLQDERWFAMIEGRWELDGGIDPVAYRNRVVDAVEDVIGRFPGRRVVVVCHGGAINAYLGHVAGIERPLWFEPAYTSISRVAASRAGVRSIVSVNEMAHLRSRAPG